MTEEALLLVGCGIVNLPLCGGIKILFLCFTLSLFFGIVAVIERSMLMPEDYRQAVSSLYL